MEECDSENLQTAPGCHLTSCLFLSLAVRIIFWLLTETEEEDLDNIICQYFPTVWVTLRCHIKAPWLYWQKLEKETLSWLVPQKSKGLLKSMQKIQTKQTPQKHRHE